ncbi:MAG: hypothetical protein IGS38_17175 [Synechococcales cyanobacterium M58_A2018_015]|nr:hypothetical protein [Synechococcales cyanobacterium M58_A2018_015]
MVTVVVVCNVLIAAGCWYVAWRMWRLRQALSRAAEALISAERSTRWVLHQAPLVIGQQQQDTHHLRWQYRQVERQLRHVQRLVTLLGLSQLVWRRWRRYSSRASHELTARYSANSRRLV